MMRRALQRLPIIYFSRAMKITYDHIALPVTRRFPEICIPSRQINQINMSLRNYSSEAPIEEVIVDYDYVKKATSNKNILLIDVREPEEVKEHGAIPNSINIPLGNVSPALGTMSESEFEKYYKIQKPTEDTEIIFYCMIGRRSGMAQQNAINLGYKNTKNYLGSWTDWASKMQ